MDKVKATANDAGCWVDGVRGYHALVRMVDIAEQHGYPLSEGDRDMVERYDTGSTDHDSVIHTIADEAESWLNDNVAPDGYSFGWHDGDFMLWSESDWSEIYDA